MFEGPSNLVETKPREKKLIGRRSSNQTATLFIERSKYSGPKASWQEKWPFKILAAFALRHLSPMIWKKLRRVISVLEIPLGLPHVHCLALPW